MSRKADREREDRRRVAETIDSPVAAPRPTSPVPMRANGDANMASSSSSQDEGISVLQAQLHEVRFAYNVALRHTSACPIFKVSNHHLTGAIRIALEMTLKLFLSRIFCLFISLHLWPRLVQHATFIESKSLAAHFAAASLSIHHSTFWRRVRVALKVIHLFRNIKGKNVISSGPVVGVVAIHCSSCLSVSNLWVSLSAGIVPL